MDLDFSRVDDVEDYVSIPPGDYVCRVTEVREGWTRLGDPRWSVRLEVADGEYAGKSAAWDFLSFGDKGVRRTKHVLAAFGFRTTGQLSIEPGDLVGRRALVAVMTEERVDPNSGVKQVRTRVPYEGYTTLDEPQPSMEGAVFEEGTREVDEESPF